MPSALIEISPGIPDTLPQGVKLGGVRFVLGNGGKVVQIGQISMECDIMNMLIISVSDVAQAKGDCDGRKL